MHPFLWWMTSEAVMGTDLIARAQTGDIAAFERLVEPLYEKAFQLAAAMLDDRAQAEDAVQEALILAWRKLDRFRYGEDIRPWLMTLVANQCRETRRRRWWSVRKVADPPEQAHESESDRVVADADLHSALQTLSERDRLILILRYFFDLPYEEVAQIARVSPDAARKASARALARLRDRLREEEA